MPRALRSVMPKLAAMSRCRTLGLRDAQQHQGMLAQGDPAKYALKF
jgi:hypothetical protein